jgi:hypothetical protein
VVLINSSFIYVEFLFLVHSTKRESFVKLSHKLNEFKPSYNASTVTACNLHAMSTCRNQLSRVMSQAQEFSFLIVFGLPFFRIVTDLTNALPGNSSLNTVQHAIIHEAVFYVVRAEQRWNNGVMQPVSLSKGSVNTLPRRQ